MVEKGNTMIRSTIATGMIALLGSVPMALAETDGIESAVEGFQRILPRGQISALVDPVFVSAASADLPDTAWILGFEHEGYAYAYDLNLLNSHEVVNHLAGDLPVAAVW
jgi:hypothetical protein